MTREVDYDVRGPVSEIRIKPPAGTPLIEKWAYTYTDVLNVATLTDSASRLTTYGYDSLDRLTSADHPTLPPPLDTLPDLETFAYDGVGNRTMSGYAHDANHRMRTSPGHSYDYDDDGNTKVRDPGTSGQASYTWDLENRLTAYASGATSAAYTQDPFARRLRKSVGSTTTWYLWSGDRLLAEYSGAGTRTTRYTPLDGFAPAQMAVPSGGSELIYDVHADRLDTPRVMTSSAGAVVWQAAYEAYGQAHLATGLSTPLNVRLPGQYLDAESSLHYNFFRTYDPGTGRYVSADPIGQAGGINVYRYARNNPLRFFDPFGLEEGSASNVKKRKAVAQWALDQNGSTDFSYDANLSPQYPAGSNKCSGFTCAAAASSGADTTVTVPDGEGGTKDRCPTAAELGRGSVPDWRLLGPGESPEAGDIMADPFTGGVPGVTGHAAVVVPDGSGGTTTQGAHANRVGPPGADHPSNPRYRRYTGD
ncbi:MAG: RHS repeat-associated core domain-containing protein [Deltaproteobacteria bacterium]|nr:RHS repeat-associated core domain-containing protein [Deltaproteobacteria bacterium]